MTQKNKFRKRVLIGFILVLFCTYTCKIASQKEIHTKDQDFSYYDTSPFYVLSQIVHYFPVNVYRTPKNVQEIIDRVIFYSTDNADSNLLYKEPLHFLLENQENLYVETTTDKSDCTNDSVMLLILTKGVNDFDKKKNDTIVEEVYERSYYLEKDESFRGRMYSCSLMDNSGCLIWSDSLMQKVADGIKQINKRFADSLRMRFEANNTMKSDIVRKIVVLEWTKNKLKDLRNETDIDFENDLFFKRIYEFLYAFAEENRLIRITINTFMWEISAKKS